MSCSFVVAIQRCCQGQFPSVDRFRDIPEAIWCLDSIPENLPSQLIVEMVESKTEESHDPFALCMWYVLQDLFFDRGRRCIDTLSNIMQTFTLFACQFPCWCMGVYVGEYKVDRLSQIFVQFFFNICCWTSSSVWMSGCRATIEIRTNPEAKST